MTEDRYTKIPNSILEGLITAMIPAESMCIALFIARKTFGFNKRADGIPLTQFTKALGLDRGNICRSLRRLVASNIVIKNIGKISEYGLNEDISSWIVSSVTRGQNDTCQERHVARMIITSGQDDTTTSGQDDTTTSGQDDTLKEYSLKENNTKKTISKKSDRSPQSLTSYPPHYEAFWEAYPQSRRLNKVGAWKCYQARLKEGVTPEQLLSAAVNYSEYCRITSTPSNYIMHPSTFLGSNNDKGNCYEDYLDAEKVKAMTRPVKDVDTRRGIGKSSDFIGGPRKL